MEGEAPPAATAAEETQNPGPAAPAPATPSPAPAANEPKEPAATPPSPPFADVPLAIASVTAEETGANKCPYCDVPTLTNLGEALLTASVEAAILSTTGNVFEKAEPRIQPLFGDLCAHLKAQTNGGTLPVRSRT